MIENLETDNWQRFLYYHHTKYPLHIDVDYNKDEGYIDCTVFKMYRLNITREMKKSSKVHGNMTKEQIEEYVLDVVEIFLNK